MNKKILLVAPVLALLATLNTSCNNKKSETDGDLVYIENSNGYCVDSLSNVDRKKITSIVVPSTHNGKPVNEISKGAFKGCSNLISITLPFIGHTAQSTGAGGLFGYVFGDEMWEEAGAYTWQTYSLSDDYDTEPDDYAQYVIPRSLRNVTVTNASMLTPGAFSMCTYLRNITFADTCNIEELGNFAFYKCGSLKTFNFPNGLKTIGRQAFSGCYNLLEIKIPSGVEIIKHNAFSNCASLIRIYVPETVKNMGKLVFNNIQAGVILLESKEPGENWDNEWSNASSTVVYDYDDGGFHYANDCEYALCGKGDDKYAFLMQWTGATEGEVTIKGQVDIDGKTYEVRSLGPRIFQETDISKITIEEGVKNISASCFENSPKLETIVFPSSLESIGSSAFIGCNKLTSLDFKNVKTIGREAFKNCSKLKSIDLGNKMETIGESAFENDEKLLPGTLLGEKAKPPLVFPSTIKKIGKSAFKGCFRISGIATTYYPGIRFADNVNSEINIDESAFENAGYKSTLDHEKYLGYVRLDIDFGIKNSNKFKKFNKAVFKNAYIYRLFAFPEAVETIDEYAFYASRIYYISSLDVSEEKEVVTNSKTLDFSSSLKNIGNYAFYYNDIAFEFKNSSLTSIGNYAFQSNSNSNFKTLYLPNSITNIGSAAFNSCAYITAIHFPQNIEKLNASVFSSMSRLEKSIDENGNEEDCLYIPPYVSILSSNVFSNDIAIKQIKFNGEKILTDIGNASFSGCKALTSVDFNDLSNCKTFGSSMFSGCTVLEKIVGFGNSTQSSNKAIGESCYYGCEKIKTQIISANIQTVGAKAYMNCIGLEQIEFMGGITHLYASCFANCTSLTSFDMHDSVHTICDYAFHNCTSLGKDKNDNIFKLPKNISQKYDTTSKMGMGENVFFGWTSSQYIKVNDNNIESISEDKKTIELRWGWTLTKIDGKDDEYKCDLESTGGNPTFVYNAQ